MFLRPFLFVYDSWGLSRKNVLDFLDKCPEIKNWYAILPNSIIIITNRSVGDVAGLFRNKFKERQFILSEIPNNGYDGWLDKTVWDFVQYPKSADRWPEY